MFSTRLPENLASNQFAELLAAKQAAGVAIIDLTLSNPSCAGFSFAGRPMPQPTGEANLELYRPSSQGLVAARQAIGNYYRQQHQAPIDADNLFITASTSEAYSYLFKLLADPAEQILVPAPGYPLFDLLADLEKVEAVHYPLRQNRQGLWRLDFPVLQELLSPRSRAIIVVNPNNPTGSLLTRSELAQLEALCKQAGLALIVDEVFLDYPASTVAERPRTALAQPGEALTFVLSGFSKVLALPQAKLSWIHVGGPEQLQQLAKERLEFIADSYLSVGSLIQQQAEGLLAGREAVQREIRQRLAANETLLQGVDGLGLSPREGGWYAVIRLPPGLDDEQCCLELLSHYNLVVHPGFFYDFADERTIVLSLLCPEESFGEGLRRLQAFLISQAR